MTLPKKRKKNIPEIKEKRRTWNDEKVYTLDQIIEYKSPMFCEGYSFEADLIIMYSDLRQMIPLM